MPKKPHIDAVTAEVRPDGYTVYLGANPVYEAGNNPYESSPESSLQEGGLPLDTLRLYASITGNSIAEEYGTTFEGITEGETEQ